MLEELERRNYSEGTTRRYLRFVERFAQHFGIPECFPENFPAVLDSDDLSRTPVRLDISCSPRPVSVDRAAAIPTVKL
jgi:hypothetical protein